MIGPDLKSRRADRDDAQRSYNDAQRERSIGVWVAIGVTVVVAVGWLLMRGIG